MTEDVDGTRPSRVPTWAKVIIWVVVVAVAVVVLFTWAFPWVESLQQDPTLASTGQVLRSPR